MFGTKWKSWMESHLARVRPNNRQRREAEFKCISMSSSNDTSIILGPSSSASFIQNLSSPDTGYSTDGCSPQTAYPQLSFQKSSLSKTSILSSTGKGKAENLNNALRIRQDSPCRARSRNRNSPWISQPAMKLPSPVSGNIRRNSASTWSDSGQGSLTHRNSADSSHHRLSLLSAEIGLHSTISEEPPNRSQSSDVKETDILSDWAPTDEDVDEDMLTPTPPSPNPQFQLENMNLPTNLSVQMNEMPRAYETLQLLNQCNHVFPLPSCTAPRCLQAQLHDPLPKRVKGGKGPLGFILKLFRRKSASADREGQLPEYSRVNGKPIRSTLGGGYWLTPTPNSFRKKTEVIPSNGSTIPKGVKSDIIRLPHTTPSPYCTPTPALRDITRENWTPTATRQSPFLFQGTPAANSPASVRFVPIVTPVPVRPSPKHHPPPCPIETTRLVPAHLQSPSFNNYSPIHRLVVTGGHRVAPDSPLVRIPAHRAPLPPPRMPYPVHVVPMSSGSSPLPMLRNSRYQYIPSSNQNSPLLNNPKRMNGRENGEVKGHYYASPLVIGSGQSVNQSVNGGTWSSKDLKQRPLPLPTLPPPVDRIYERVEGLEGSDEGDGEGGDYEWDISFGDSEQSSESWRQGPPPPAPPPRQESFPMQWGTRLSETESKLLEREADLKYKRLLWEAEVLLRELSGSRGTEEFIRSKPRPPRHLLDETPQSDPLRRKTYDCWALRRLQQEMAGSCASPPVLHRSRHNLIYQHDNRFPNKPSRTLQLHHSHRI